MGLVSILTEKKQKKGIISPENVGQTEIFGLEFHAVENSDYTLSAKLTTSPIESGAKVSDHIEEDLEKVALDCIITNSPVQIFGAAQDRFKNLVQEADEFLTNLFKQKELFDLVDGFRVYTGMIMTLLERKRTAKTGNALEFTMVCEKPKIVDSEDAIVPEASISPTAAAAAEKKDIGTQGAAASSAAATQQSSILNSALTALGVF